MLLQPSWMSQEAWAGILVGKVLAEVGQGVYHRLPEQQKTGPTP